MLSRRWKQRKAIQTIHLFIVDDLHLVGSAIDGVCYLKVYIYSLLVFEYCICALLTEFEVTLTIKQYIINIILITVILYIIQPVYMYFTL